MEKESIQLVLTYLDKIAEKIGTTAEQVWPWMIRQQYVEAIYPFFTTAILGTGLCFLIKFTLKHWNPEKGYSIYSEDHEPVWIGACVILALIVIISFAVFLIQFSDIFNPEYHALLALMAMAKP